MRMLRECRTPGQGRLITYERENVLTVLGNKRGQDPPLESRGDNSER